MGKIQNIITGLFSLVMALFVAASPALAATLTVGDALLAPGATGSVEVSGDINGESTFGYTILCELKPRAGAVGILTFTPAPPVDIEQVIDPWNSIGTFSKFDTDSTGSVLLNGAVNDDGQFSGNPLVFAGPLARFFIVAGPGASGQWDVLLSTTEGDSNWENVVTVLGTGLVTITAGACVVDADCDDGNPCTDDFCNNNTCQHTGNTSPCDDGLFCTAVDVCINGVCVGSGDACDFGIECDELCDRCVSDSCPPPTVQAVGGRTFAVMPAGGTQAVALQVWGVSTPVACVQDQYINMSEHLQNTAVFLTPDQWQTVHPVGSAIIPGSDYAVSTQCTAGVFSACVAARTFDWGNANDFGRVDLDDILWELTAFAGDFSQIQPEAVDWLPCEGSLGGIVIDLDDILGTLSAFSGFGYDQVCPLSCP